MSQLTEDAGNLAAPHTITHDGVTYEFRHLGGVELASYQKERYDEALERLKNLKVEYGPEEYAKRLDALEERHDRGEFDMLADFERAGISGGVVPPKMALKVAEVMLRMMAKITGRTDKENWKLFFGCPEEVGVLIGRVIRESFGKQQAGSNGRDATGQKN